MRFIAITILALAMCACTDHTQDYSTGTLASGGSTPPPPPASHNVTFIVQGAVHCDMQFSDVNGTITIDTYTRQVTTPINIVATPPAGTAVADWQGVDWSSGSNATVLPSNAARTVTIVIAPSAGG